MNSPDRHPGPGHDGRHRNKSGSGECDRGPVHDDHYVHHEHSPDRCPGPGHDGRHRNKSGSCECDRSPVHDDRYVHHEHSPDRRPGPGHDGRHRNKSGSGHVMYNQRMRPPPPNLIVMHVMYMEKER